VGTEILIDGESVGPPTAHLPGVVRFNPSLAFGEHELQVTGLDAQLLSDLYTKEASDPWVEALR
jgi:hypothetical protein